MTELQKRLMKHFDISVQPGAHTQADHGRTRTDEHKKGTPLATMKHELHAYSGRQARLSSHSAPPSTA
jgi:hypothetical protein